MPEQNYRHVIEQAILTANLQTASGEQITMPQDAVHKLARLIEHALRDAGFVVAKPLGSNDAQRP